MVSGSKILVLSAVGIGAFILLTQKPQEDQPPNIPDLSGLQGFTGDVLSDFFSVEPSQTIASGIGNLGSGELPTSQDVAGTGVQGANATLSSSTLSPAQIGAVDINAYFRSIGLGEQVEVVGGNIVRPKEGSSLPSLTLEKALVSNPQAVATSVGGGVIFNPITPTYRLTRSFASIPDAPVKKVSSEPISTSQQLSSLASRRTRGL